MLCQTTSRHLNPASPCSVGTDLGLICSQLLILKLPIPQAIPAPEQAQRTFMAAMSDSGLKPTVVYHNLNPSELYEKARHMALQPGASFIGT